MVKKLRLVQTHSTIARNKSQLCTLLGLGLGRIGKVVQKDDTPTIRGMVNKVSHLITIEELKNNVK